MKNYSDLLKDPRWQKKRLEILNRDKFKCQCCGENNKTLHVHHWKEDYSIKPWESDVDDLITLCEDCHKALHYLYKNNEFGMETFCLVCSFYSQQEIKSINKYFESHE